MKTILPLLKNMLKHSISLTACLCLFACTPADQPDAKIHSAAQKALLGTTENSWYRESAVAVSQTNEHARQLALEPGAAKNIILFVGDGMGVSTVTAARILDGQQKGMSGEENSLSFGRFPFVGLSKTYNVDAQTADSAGTMTAIISGVKTNIGILGLNENARLGDCESARGNELFSALELAEIAGLATGIVSTARITHATPAATYAKTPDRNWENPSKMPAAAIAAGCEDIASQLIHFEHNLEARYPGADINGIEVVLGGGRREFLPADPAANPAATSKDASDKMKGVRNDGRNLITEWSTLYPDGDYVFDHSGFAAVEPDRVSHLFGLFSESHMRYAADRKNDLAGEPSLTEMTTKAIDILDNNKQGFFLMVEAGRIDHGHHANSAYAALNDTVEMSRAVQAALDATNPEETLIIVTADHSHVFTMAGYPKRGNPILGKMVQVGDDRLTLGADGLPFTTLSYSNGPGFHDFGDETNADRVYNSAPFLSSLHSTLNHSASAGDKAKSSTAPEVRPDLSEVNTEAPGFHQEALVPATSETHGGEDVPIYAIGPGAHLVTGSHEQSIIFHVINHAGNLFDRAAAALD